MVGLDAILRTVDIALQLRVTQIAKRIDGTNQLVELKYGLPGAVMPEQSANFAHQHNVTGKDSDSAEQP